MSKVLANEHVDLLKTVTGVDKVEDIKGAHSIRIDGAPFSLGSSDNVTILPRENKDGIEVYVKDGAKETIFIPVAISLAGVKETVINNFHIGKDANVYIIAGCGIDNCGEEDAQHDGIHSFFVGENSKVRYYENHYGSGTGEGDRILNPVTNIEMDKGSKMEIETIQIGGVNSSIRKTYAKVGENASLVIDEKLLTEETQYVETFFEIDLDGENSNTNVVSRSVAQGNSEQVFFAKINGNGKDSFGHSECDAIIMDSGSVKAIPEVTANHPDTQLIHEAAIGKIAGEQIVKLETLGLTEEEAEQEIVNGFLK